MSEYLTTILKFWFSPVSFCNLLLIIVSAWIGVITAKVFLIHASNRRIEDKLDEVVIGIDILHTKIRYIQFQNNVNVSRINSVLDIFKYGSELDEEDENKKD